LHETVRGYGYVSLSSRERLGVTYGRPRFRVTRNPDPQSRLPYLVWLPIERGLVLKARET